MAQFGGGFRRLSSSLRHLLRPRRSPADLREKILEGDFLLREGRLDPALKSYQKAAGIDPENVIAVKKAAMVYGMMGRYLEAIASLDGAIEIDPFDRQAWMHRGFLLWRLERWQDARGSFERAAAIDPEDGYARYCRIVTAEEMSRRRGPPGKCNSRL